MGLQKILGYATCMNYLDSPIMTESADITVLRVLLQNVSARRQESLQERLRAPIIAKEVLHCSSQNIGGVRGVAAINIFL